MLFGDAGFRYQWPQVDRKQVENFGELLLGEMIEQELHKVLLACLSKDHSVDGQRLPQFYEPK